MNLRDLGRTGADHPSLATNVILPCERTARYRKRLKAQAGRPNFVLTDVLSGEQADQLRVSIGISMRPWCGLGLRGSHYRHRNRRKPSI